MKTAISLPVELVASAEALAGRLGVSRNHLVVNALAEFLAMHRAHKITDRLDPLYAEDLGSLDPSMARAQRRTLARSEW